MIDLHTDPIFVYRNEATRDLHTGPIFVYRNEAMRDFEKITYEPHIDIDKDAKYLASLSIIILHLCLL